MHASPCTIRWRLISARRDARLDLCASLARSRRRRQVARPARPLSATRDARFFAAKRRSLARSSRRACPASWPAFGRAAARAGGPAGGATADRSAALCTHAMHECRHEWISRSDLRSIHESRETFRASGGSEKKCWEWRRKTLIGKPCSASSSSPSSSEAAAPAPPQPRGLGRWGCRQPSGRACGGHTYRLERLAGMRR